MSRHGGLGLPLLGYLAVVLILAPLVGFVALWTWFVMAGLSHYADIEQIKEAGAMWMTLLLGGAMVCLIAEWVLIPLLLSSGERRRRWLSAPLSLALGFAAGAGVFLLIKSGRIDFDPMLHGRVDFSAGIVAPVASVIAFALTAGLVAWLFNRRSGSGNDA